jgi:hypothetical protein
MNATEIMTNEEVNGVTTEIVTGGSKTAVKVIAAIGGAGLVGYVIYKGVKAIAKRRKAKKELIEATEGYNYLDESDLEDDNVEDED